MAARALRTPADDGYLLVAAIDFGTTYSGYAWSFVSDGDKKNHEDIRVNKGWPILEYQVRLEMKIELRFSMMIGHPGRYSYDAAHNL